MKALVGIVIVGILVLALGMMAAPTDQPAAAELRLPKDFAIPLSLQPLEREYLPLEQGIVKRTDPRTGEVLDTTVRLRRTTYQAYWLRSYSGSISSNSAQIRCYELVSDAPYAWAYWPTSPHLANFRLISLPDDKSYLAWVEGPDMRIALVGPTVDPSVALMQYFRAIPDPTIYVPVSELLPRSRHWGMNALYSEIEIVSLTKSGSAGLELTISNPAKTDSATLVYDGHQWRLPEGQGEGAAKRTTE